MTPGTLALLLDVLAQVTLSVGAPDFTELAPRVVLAKQELDEALSQERPSMPNENNIAVGVGAAVCLGSRNVFIGDGAGADLHGYVDDLVILGDGVSFAIDRVIAVGNPVRLLVGPTLFGKPNPVHAALSQWVPTAEALDESSWKVGTADGR